MLEKEAVSQVERLRTEVAIRLQQINNRVEKALSQVGMSRWDEQVVSKQINRDTNIQIYKERTNKSRYLQF